MKAKELITDYINCEITAVETIRILSAVDLLALINQICRIELGDLSIELYREIIESE
jgi:hypothetical protein